MASKERGTTYIGVTNNLSRRVYEHKNELVEGFSKKYQTHLLVYFEEPKTMYDAILREKQLKRWKRSWKIRLIEETNQKWRDLSKEIIFMDKD